MAKAYDQANAGWGKSKLVDGPTLGWFLDRAKAGDSEAAERLKRTLTAQTRADRQGRRRHQPGHAGARLVEALARVPDVRAAGRPRRLFARLGDVRRSGLSRRGRPIYGFLKSKLAGPGGGFYASMGLAEGRPGVDKRQYARETGQAIQGIAAYHDATGNKEALSLAIAAADWALRERQLSGGGFNHSGHDAAGPYLADTLEMGAALLALHRSTGDRKWLVKAMAAGDFIAATSSIPGPAASSPPRRPMPAICRSRSSSARTTSLPRASSPCSPSIRDSARYRELAEAGMGYLASPAVLESAAFLPDVLLAEDELRQRAGARHRGRSQGRSAQRRASCRGARLSAGLQAAEWWDKREGKLTNPDVDYPDFPDGPAAFACTRTFCSLPVTDAAAIPAQLDRLQRGMQK
jgi:uncharacterized protein YyaL (SSP411 family)